MPKKKKAALYDIRDIWAIAWKRKWLIMIPLVIVGSITYGVSFMITPEFESSAIIEIDQEVPLTTELQRLLGTEARGFGRNDQRRDQLRGYYNELTSTAYLSKLVEKLDLDEDPMLDQQARQIGPNAGPDMLAAIKFDLIQSRLKSKINVSFAAQQQIEIRFQSTSATLARDVTNTLGEIFIEEKIVQDLTSIRSSQDFSDTQLEKYEKQVKDKIGERTQIERRLLQIQLDETITSEANRSQITAEIDRSNTDIQEYRKQEREILRTLANEHGMTTSNLSLDETDSYSEHKRELRQQISSLAEQMTKYSWSDPQILNYKLRQNNLLKDMEAENRTAVNNQYSNQSQAARDELTLLFNIRTNLDFMYSKVSYLTAANDDLVAKMNQVPELQSELNRLNEEIAAATDLRDRFKRQQESSDIKQNLIGTSSKYRFVEQANLPLEPFHPDRKKIVMMGIALGLMIGAGAAVVVELLDNSLKKVEEVEEFLDLPVLGIAPKADFMKKVG